MIFVYWLVVFFVFLIGSIAHELGHVLVLRIFKIPIYRISLGFGPTLKEWSLKDQIVQRVAIKLFPLQIGVAFDLDEPNFQKLGHWSKILVFVAGVLVNVFIAIVVSLFIRSEGVIRPSLDLIDVTRVFVVINLLFAFSNLFPFSKFDGGKIFDCLSDRYLSKKSGELLQNLRIFITLILAFLIFYFYRFWI